MGTFIETWNFTQAVKIFTRLPADRVENLSDEGRITARRVSPIAAKPFSLIALHVPSKLWRTNSDQASWMAHTLRPFIEDIEAREGHQRTVLIGDFNANPFEEGIVAAMGVHGTSTRAVASRRTRRVDGKETMLFYNPMWSILGDASPGPPGTFFARGSGHHELFWHMFDQVLIRPDLLPHFQSDGIEILTNTGKRTLLNHRAEPDSKTASDHLPIFMNLNF
jgi:endonuclease/exonuclease/phosphatase family metal-dependent hydrolase